MKSTRKKLVKQLKKKNWENTILVFKFPYFPLGINILKANKLVSYDSRLMSYFFFCFLHQKYIHYTVYIYSESKDMSNTNSKKMWHVVFTL